MVFAATSCKKEKINEPENDLNREPAANEFLATIDDGGMALNAPRVNDGMGTLATFDQTDKLKVMWQQGDVIYVNGTANAFTCNSDPKNSNRAYFENKTDFPTGYQAEVYHAFYSTSVTPNADASGTLSAIQYYNPENQAENLPMYAHSTDHWLNFSNICAAIKIYVPCTADHIVISNTSAPLHGNFTINESNVAVMESITDDEYKKITIRKKIKAPQVDDDFHACDSLFIAIPAGTYAGFQIAFYDGNDSIIYTTGPSGNNLRVEANKIYKIAGYKYTDLLPGVFTAANGTLCRFTAGNLTGTSDTGYGFASNQTEPGTYYDNTGAEAFNPNRHHYTLKEANSMGLLCLPIAGYYDGSTLVDYDGSGRILARYWSISSVSQTYKYLKIGVKPSTFEFEDEEVKGVGDAPGSTYRFSIRLCKSVSLTKNAMAKPE